MNRKLLCAALGAMLVAGTAMPNVANATGYIRVGDKCFVNTGIEWPNWVQVACPREVSENP